MHELNSSIDRPPRKILLVDDNPDIHNDFRRVLCMPTDHSGALTSAKAILLGGDSTSGDYDLNVDITSAFQGEDAVRLVRQAIANGEPYRLAFVDVRMPPGIDGIETIAQMWAIDPKLQVVICSAFSDYSWEDTCKRLEHSENFLILKKPYDIAVVRQMACSLLAKQELTQQVEQQIADMDRETRYTKAVIESCNDAYLELDSVGRVIGWGNKAEALFGWKADDIHCEYISKILKLPRDSNETVEAWLDDLCSQSVGQRREMTAVNSDGRDLPVEVSISSVKLGGSNFFNVFVHDISARRKLQTQLGHAQKMESVGHLAAGIAHEINTPTQYVGDNARFLLDSFSDIGLVLRKYDELLQAAKAGDVTDDLIAATESEVAKADIEYLLDEIPNAIDQSLEGVARIATIVRAMKTFSHPGQKEKTDTDIHQAIESAITISRNEWKYVAEVETDFASNMPLVSCQAGDVNQVFLNLIVNAAHAIADVVGTESGEQGKITITTRVVDDWAEFRFSDTGTGIAEENRASLYDAFFTTKEVGKGTGQGLAIAHTIIVDGHDGTIDFETEVGKGTTFIIRLPLHVANDSTAAELEDSMIG